MARLKKDSNLATVSYNLKNVELATGFTTALINSNHQYHESLAKAAEYYGLSSIESAMVYVETFDLIAPQFRSVQILEPVASEVITTSETAIADYTIEEIEAKKDEVRAKLIASKQKRAAAKQ